MFVRIELCYRNAEGEGPVWRRLRRFLSVYADKRLDRRARAVSAYELALGLLLRTRSVRLIAKMSNAHTEPRHHPASTSEGQ